MSDEAMTDALRGAVRAAGWHRHPPADPGDSAAYLALLDILYETGRRDLPLGRLLEGHVDAVQIARRLATADQRAALDAALAAGALLGVWNAALPEAPATLADARLSGGKAYASGAGILTHALVTADTGAGPQLLLVDLSKAPPAIDRDWWKTTGMQRSATHLVRWTDAAMPREAWLGAPGAYAAEPHFSGGALRFVAVHAGGIAGIVDRVCAHLVGAGRANDPFQAARLAALFGLADAAAACVRRMAERWFESDGETRLAGVAATRLAVADLAERAIAVALQAVGLPGMFVTHPLATHVADLTVYLRQPAPDAQRLRVGRAVAAGALAPRL